MKKIVFLASGNGGNLKFLNSYLALSGNGGYEIAGVIADRPCGALEYAAANNLRSRLIHYGRNDRQGLLAGLKEMNPDYIITNIHKILDEELVGFYGDRMINLHYSLLPAFPGLIGMKAVDAAVEKNCRFVGATTHFLNAKVDDGRIIAQSCFSLDASMGKATLYDLTFKSGCLILLNSLLMLGGAASGVCASSLEFHKTRIEFSPELMFNPDTISGEPFWNGLK